MEKVVSHESVTSVVVSLTLPTQSVRVLVGNYPRDTLSYSLDMIIQGYPRQTVGLSLDHTRISQGYIKIFA